MSGPTQGSDPPERPSNPLADTVPASSPPEHAKDLDEPAPSRERYRLGAELGRGGMGRVVEAFDTHLGRTVALKEVLPGGGATVTKRFQREIQITARLEHAAIVPLYDSGVTIEGLPYYVMRRVSGKPLDQLIERAHGLPERLALLPNVLAAIEAIAHAHKRGVIHRDLKPANILVGELGETVVIDWGLAKVVGETDPDADPLETRMPSAADSLKTQIGSVFGTPGFMAPEQARGEELDQRGDVFALGATLYHLIAGKPPVAGNSATEVISSTIQAKIVPVSRLVPEAPAELVAIIGKALSGDPAERYPNAGALADDVRSFLTGQLVAAHEYTRWQRVSRFAKRHRGALGVAAAASVAVAVLAWVSVHRVLTERDAARSARVEADKQRKTADEKAAELRQRADELTLAHARSLLDTSPTEAVAQLKPLEASAPAVVAEAKALVKAAMMRGVARGVPALAGPTVSFQMTRDGKRLVQVNRDGELQVVDLVVGRAVVTREVGRGSTAEWVNAGKLLLISRDRAPPQLLDPTTGASPEIGTAPFKLTSATATGDLVAYVDIGGNLGLLDIHTRATTPLWTSGKVTHDVVIAPDGSYVAFTEALDRNHSRLVIIDRTGKLIAERPGRPTMLAVSPTGTLAVATFDDIVEVKPRDPAPAFAKVGIEITDAHMAHWLSFRGETLVICVNREVLEWNGTRLWRSEPINDVVYLAEPVGERTVAATAADNAIHLMQEGASLTLPITNKPAGTVRLAVAPGSTRIAAAADDAILIWDIAGLFPTYVTSLSGSFIDDRHLLVMGGSTPDWHVIDVETGADQTISMRPPGIALGVDLGDDGRFLAIVEYGNANGAPLRSVVVVSADHQHQQAFGTTSDIAVLVPPDGVVMAGDKGHVLGTSGSAKPRELVTLDGQVRAVCPTGPRSFAAISNAGDLVRATLDGAIDGRTRVDFVRNAFISCDGQDVLLVEGNRLLRWSTDVHELAKFTAEPAGTIVAVHPTPTGSFVGLANKETYFLARGERTPRRVPLTREPRVSSHGNVIVSLSTSGQIELVDLPSLAKWTIPKIGLGAMNLEVSSDGTRVVQGNAGELAVWHLPQPPGDYGAWLDELTNADIVEGHLVWPWKRSSP